jgi:hypothetical protein
MLSLQRQVVKNAVVMIGHHNMVIDEAKPATPSLCLSLSQPNEVVPGSNLCGPFAETGVFTTAASQVVQARQELGPPGGSNLGSDGWFRTMVSSAYYALQSSMQYTAGRTTALVAYTFSKAMDNSSAATEQIKPFDPSLEWALSSFNVKLNFATSYSYQIPFEKAYSHTAVLTKVDLLRDCQILNRISRYDRGKRRSLADW